MNLEAPAVLLAGQPMINQECRFGSDLDIGIPPAASEEDGRRPRIFVIYTSIEGTLAALNAAVHLARGLEAEIVLLVAEELALYYRLDRPPIATAYFAKVCKAILMELDLEGTEIQLEICFCRSQAKCFQTALHPRSIVVLGAALHFWRRREHKLARTLRALGHDAVVVEAEAFGHLSKRVVQRMTHDHVQSETRLLSRPAAQPAASGVKLGASRLSPLARNQRQQ